MAYATLIIDHEELVDIQTGLAFVHQELGNLKNITKQINGMIGDPEPDLKGAVSSVESSWDNNREDILKAASSMSDAVTTVIDNWSEWDTENAAKLSEGLEEDGQS